MPMVISLAFGMSTATTRTPLSRSAKRNAALRLSIQLGNDKRFADDLG